MGVKLVHLSKVGMSGDLYVMRPFHAPTDPGYGGGVPANPTFPDNSLPGGPPAHVPEGTMIVLVKDPAGVWHYGTVPPGTAVTPLPELPPTEAAPKAY